MESEIPSHADNAGKPLGEDPTSDINIVEGTSRVGDDAVIADKQSHGTQTEASVGEGKDCDEDSHDSDRSDGMGDEAKTSSREWPASFINYLNRLENRVKHLEKNLQNSDAARDEEKTPRQMVPRPNVVQFFLVDDEPPVNRRTNRWEDPRSFMYERHTQHPMSIDALYRWMKASPGSAKERDKQNPQPEDVDILEIRIASRVIAEFLDVKLEFEISKNGVVHFTKPFRTLIRSFALVKSQLSMLETKHG